MSEALISLPPKTDLFDNADSALDSKRAELEKAGYVFLERLRKKQKFDSSGKEVNFDIYCLETGDRFELLVQKAVGRGFEETLAGFETKSWEAASAGRYHVFNVNLENDPRKFLNIPESFTDLPTVMSDGYVEDFSRGYGLASRMIEIISAKLSQNPCLHIVAFTKQGFDRLHQKYLQLGYADTEVVDQDQEKLIYGKDMLDTVEPTPYLAWVYRAYRPDETYADLNPEEGKQVL